MTLDYYIYEIKQLLPEEQRLLDNRLVKRWIDLTRATWMKNEMSKHHDLSKDFLQSIFIELSPVDESLIEGIGTKYKILKGTSNLPKLLFFNTFDGIVSIRNARILSTKYNYVTREQAVYSGNGKVNNKDIFTFIHNNEIYLKIPKDNYKAMMLTHLVIDCYLITPSDINNFKNPEDIPWNFIYDEYPISDTLWTYMREVVVQNGIMGIQATKQDEEKLR